MQRGEGESLAWLPLVRARAFEAAGRALVDVFTRKAKAVLAAQLREGELALKVRNIRSEDSRVRDPGAERVIRGLVDLVEHLVIFFVHVSRKGGFAM